MAILAVYVDDIAVFATRGTMGRVKKELMTLFQMRDMGEIRYFLGFQITRDRKAMTIKMSQDRYIKTLVE